MSALEKVVLLCLFGCLVYQIVRSAMKLQDCQLGVIMAKETEMQQEFPSVTVCALVDSETDMHMNSFSEIGKVEDAFAFITYPHWDGTKYVSSIYLLYCKLILRLFQRKLNPC